MGLNRKSGKVGKKYYGCGVFFPAFPLFLFRFYPAWVSSGRPMRDFAPFAARKKSGAVKGAAREGEKDKD